MRRAALLALAATAVVIMAAAVACGKTGSTVTADAPPATDPPATTSTSPPTTAAPTTVAPPTTLPPTTLPPTTPAPTTTTAPSPPATEAPPPPAPVEPAPVAPASSSVWDDLAYCETGGNWSHPPVGSYGYSGGLMFLPSTWSAYGGHDFAPAAHLASRDAQIVVAERILASHGGTYRAWPGCRAKLGLP